MTLQASTITYAADADLGSFIVDLLSPKINDYLCIGCTITSPSEVKIEFIIKTKPQQINSFVITKDPNSNTLKLPEVTYD